MHDQNIDLGRYRNTTPVLLYDVDSAMEMWRRMIDCMIEWLRIANQKCRWEDYMMQPLLEHYESDDGSIVICVVKWDNGPIEIGILYM